MLVFLIAGEASGDRLGASLMAGLRELAGDVAFDGIGGPLMRSCQDRIMTWWDSAYQSGGENLRERFSLEAESSLPGLLDDSRGLDTVFESVLGQRARLRQNQQVPEWLGGRYAQ